MDVLKFVPVGLAGWLNQSQQWVIETLQEDIHIAGIIPELQGEWTDPSNLNATGG